MRRLSIVIPAWGSWAELEASLVSVLENRPEDCEIVVPLNQPYADPYDLRDEVRFLELPAEMDLVDAWNQSLALCRGSIVHFLACGATVDGDWATNSLACFNDCRLAAVAPSIAAPDGVLTAGWSVSRGGACRRIAISSITEPREAHWEGPTSIAAFYRRAALPSVGPSFDASLGEELAALDLCLRLREAGHRVVLDPTSRIATSRALPQPPARRAERLFWRHAGSRGWLGSAAAHAAMVAGEFCRVFPRPRSLTTAFGRLIGACQHRARDTVRYRLEPFEPDEAEERRVDPPHVSATLGRRLLRRVAP